MAEDTKVNLKLGFDQKTQYICVEYPAVVKNKEKMIKSLGGLNHIAKVHDHQMKRLALNFRPDDPCCKPVCANKTACTGLLVRVRKYRRKASKNQQSNEFCFRQHICGIVNTVYKFNTMCDYQYMSVKKNDKSEFESMLPSVSLEEFCKLSSEEVFHRKASLFLPPLTFSRTDTQQDYFYKNDSAKFVPSKSNKTLIGMNRPRRNHNAILVKFEEEMPKQLLKEAMDAVQKAIQNPTILDKFNEVKVLFNQRPIWSKNALQNKMSVSSSLLTLLLPAVAYYYSTGPWRSLWVRIGYDPKSDPHSKQYQVLDFRIRQGVNTPLIPIKAKRSTYHYKLPLLIPKSNKKYAEQTHFEKNPSTQNENSTEGTDENVKDTSYVYKAGVLPAHRQIFYQACDIFLPEVQDLLNSATASTCSKEDGWFLPNTAGKVRNIINKDVVKTISHAMGTNSLLTELDPGTSSQDVSNNASTSASGDPDEGSDDFEDPFDDDDDLSMDMLVESLPAANSGSEFEEEETV